MKKDAPTLSILIPTFNRSRLLKECLESVGTCSVPCEILVVDNASTDETPQLVKDFQRTETRIRYFRQPYNLGAGRNFNCALKLAQGNFICMLGDDDAVLPGNFERKIALLQEHPDIGLVYSLWYRIDAQGKVLGVVMWPGLLSYSYVGGRDEFRDLLPASYIMLQAVLFRRELYDLFGNFDESRSLAAGSDWDLLLRYCYHTNTAFISEPLVKVRVHEQSYTFSVGRKGGKFAEGRIAIWRKWLVENDNPPVLDESLWQRMYQAFIPDLQWEFGDDREKIEYYLRALLDIKRDSIRKISACFQRNSELKTIQQSAIRTLSHSTRFSAAKLLNEVNIVWNAPIFDPSGYADEARNFVITLQKQGVTVRINPITKTDGEFVEQLNPELKNALFQLTQTEIKDNWVNVVHFPAYAFNVDKRAIANVGRVMFETDRLPDGWVEKCNQMDEIWAPTDFNLETFAKAGVHPDKLVKVPSGIDSNLYNPNMTPLEIPQQHGFTFLSVFQWSYRKGWDVLLKAYIEEFSPDEDVCLILRTYPINKNSDTIAQDIEKFITQKLQRNFDETPDIIILEAPLGIEQMPQLYAAVDAFVLPSRGEGWGRPFMEAMAMGIPTIGTRWSGNLEFMNDENSYLIDIEGLVEVSDKMEIPFYFGHKWAQPSVEHLRHLMRHVYENRDEAKAKGEQARRDIIENYTWEKVSEIIIQRLSELVGKSKGQRAKSGGQMSIIWEGSQFVYHSLALVNRELCIALAQSSKCELSIIPYEPHQFGVEVDPERFGLIDERLNKPLSGSADFHIRHQWPPKFEPPKEGYWILMQPWEYGSMPKEWLPHLRDQIDEVWVYSNYNRDCYIHDGLDPDKVAVVPLSVDHTRFHPDAEPLPLIDELTKKSFKFLFVGGTIWRKGIDVLLNAYAQAFTREDDVCLVIKDIGQSSFYAGQTAYDLIKEIQSDPNAPEIIHLTEMLPQEDMPRLYTACDCLVHPYRGEGFCLPVAEAMACGLPVIVTKGGACDDFCTDDTVCWISASRLDIKTQEETVNQAWVLEPDLESLVAQMRHVVANPEEAKTRGKKASEYIRQTLSWEKSAELILERLAALKANPIPRNRATVSGKISIKKSQQPSEDMVAMQEKPLDGTEIRAQQYFNIANQYKDLGELERDYCAVK